MGLNDYPILAARLARTAIAIQQRTRSEVRKKVGIPKVPFSLFMNEHVALLPDQLKALCDELGITNKVIELGARGINADDIGN